MVQADNRVKNLFWMIFCILLVLFFVSCEKKEQKSMSPVEQLRISVVKGNSTALFYLASEHGFFKTQHLDILSQEFQSGKSALQDLLKGNADIATATEFAFVSQSFSHPELRILGVIATFINKHFICGINSDIQIPSDIKGKRIGVTKKSGGEYLLGIFLQNHKIKLQEVEIVDLKPKKIVEALIAGTIDVALTWEPYIFDIKKLLENNFITWPAQGDQYSYTLLIAKESWLQENPQKVERFLRAISYAENYANETPGAIEGFLLKAFLYEKAYVDSILPDHKMHLGLPDNLSEAMTLEAKWRIRSGLSAQQVIPDYQKKIYYQGIKKAKEK